MRCHPVTADRLSYSMNSAGGTSQLIPCWLVSSLIATPACFWSTIGDRDFPPLGGSHHAQCCCHGRSYRPTFTNRLLRHGVIVRNSNDFVAGINNAVVSVDVNEARYRVAD